MRRLLVSSVALVTAAACAPMLGAHVRDLPAKMTLQGVGGVRPGMTPAQVEGRWRVKLRLDRAVSPGCATALVRLGGMSGYALFENDRFGAVWFRKGAVTPAGIRIGSTVGALREAYGFRLGSRPNKYTPGARDYFLRSPSRPRWELRFDVSPRGRVTEIAFGNRAVRYVEGCA